MVGEVLRWCSPLFFFFFFLFDNLSFLTDFEPVPPPSESELSSLFVVSPSRIKANFRSSLSPPFSIYFTTPVFSILVVTRAVNLNLDLFLLCSTTADFSSPL